MPSDIATTPAPRAALVAILAVLVGVAFFLFADPFVSPPDTLSYWVWGESLFTDIDFGFRDEYEQHELPAIYAYVTETGRLANDWPPGTGLLLGPWTLAGRVAAHAWMALLAVAVLAWWYRGLDLPGAGLATVAVVAGTPLLFYLLFGPFFSHIASFLATTAFLTLWHRTRPAETRSEAAWLLLGLLAGIASAIRPQNALLGVVFFVELPQAIASWRARPRKLLMLVAGGLLGVAPQLIAWQALYGSPLALPKVEEMHWLSPAIGKVLLSDFHGILPWTPVYLPAVLGLLLARRDGRLACALLLVFASQLYLNAANFVWWSGGSFGNRRMLDGAIVVAWGIAALFAFGKGRGWRVGTIACVAACCSWTLLLLLAERAGKLPLDRYVPFVRPAEMRPAFLAALLEPADTVRGLLRWREGVGIGGTLARGACAALLSGATFVLLRVRRSVRITMARATAGATTLVVLMDLLCVVALVRTGPLQADGLAERIGTRPRVLWDNYIEYAYYCMLRNDPAGAEDAALKAVELRPDHYSGWFELGRARLMMGSFTSAVEAFDEALRLNPDHERSKLLKARALGLPPPESAP